MEIYIIEGYKDGKIWVEDSQYEQTYVYIQMGPEHILGKSAPVFHNYKHHEPLCHICSTGSSQGECFFSGGVFFSQGGYFFRGVSFPLTHNEL